MSHHFDSPTAIEDGRINLSDLYAFPGPGSTTTLILNVNPDAGRSSPTTLRPDALYEFVIASDGGSVEDCAIRIVFDEPDPAGRQRMTVRLAAGEDSRTGVAGVPLGSGLTGEVILLDGGGRAWSGVATDPFWGDGFALAAFNAAVEAGEDRSDLFGAEPANVFDARNVTAIVVEIPNATLGGDEIALWARISLYGHAPQRQVSRIGNPMVRPLFFPAPGPDSEAINAGSPADDVQSHAARLEQIAARVARARPVRSGWPRVSRRRRLPARCPPTPSGRACPIRPGDGERSRPGRRCLRDRPVRPRRDRARPVELAAPGSRRVPLPPGGGPPGSAVPARAVRCASRRRRSGRSGGGCVMTIRPAAAGDGDRLVDIWLRSVRATHTFLSEVDIQGLLPFVHEELNDPVGLDLWVLIDDHDMPVGFAGLAGAQVAALFLDPDRRRRGGGRLLIEQAQRLHGRLTVDVNEQNPEAVRFYEVMGFEVVGRSPDDDAGRPFPILHMRQPEPGDVTTGGGTIGGGARRGPTAS